MSYVKMTTDGATIRRGIFRLAIPVLCSNVLQILSSSVSAFWVGRYLGEAALAAVVNAQSMMFLVNGVALGVAMAATVLVSQCMGGGYVAQAKRVVSTGVQFFFVLSMALAVLGLTFATPLLVAMQTAPEVLPLAVLYMRVMLLGLPGAYLFAFVISVLIGVGDSATPLRFTLLSVVLVAGLSPVFMFAAHVAFSAGVAGAASATAVAQACGLLALLGDLYHRGHPLCLAQQDLSIRHVDWAIVRELILKGIPMGAQIFVISLSSVLMIALVNRFGVDTTAAYGAMIQLWIYISLPALAMAVAVSSTAAQSIGAQNWEQVRRTARIGIAYSFIATGLVIAVIFAASDYVYRLFLPEGSAALSIARHINQIVTWSLIFVSIPVVLFGVMRAAGAVMVPLLIHILSLLVFRYPLARVLSENWHADAIWWSFTISHGIDVILAVLYYRHGSWRRSERLKLSDIGARVPGQ